MSLTMQAESDVETFESSVLAPFMEGTKQSLAQLAREVQESSEQFEQEAGERKATLQQLQALVEQQSAEARTESARTAELESAVAALALRAGTLLPAQLASLEKQVHAAALSKDQLAAQLTEVEAQHQRELVALSRGVALFRRVLGVEFAAVKGQLHVRFAFIRPSAGDALTHSLSLLVDGQKQYQVTSCTPALDSMPRLLAELNHNSNFAAFIGRARREFIKAEQKEKQSA
jgi:hypothetical protein